MKNLIAVVLVVLAVAALAAAAGSQSAKADDTFTYYLPIVQAPSGPEVELDPLPGTYSMSTVRSINIEYKNIEAPCTFAFAEPIGAEPGSWINSIGYCDHDDVHLNILFIEPTRVDQIKFTFSYNNGEAVWYDVMNAAYIFEP